MADDFGFQPIAQPVPPADDFGFQPLPKMPDTSGVQKMVQGNLAANDNKGTDEAKSPDSPSQRFGTALGVPLQSLMNPDDKTPIPAPMRKAATKAYADGSASTGSDFMQTALHAAAPIVAGLANPVEQAKKLGRTIEATLSGVGEGYEEGTIFPTPNTSNVGTMAGAAANIPFQAMSSAFSGFQRGISQAGQEYGAPQLGKELALLPEEAMGLEGIQMHLPEQAAPHPAAGIWENHPGSEPIAQEVAKRTGKDVSQVATPDIEQAIADGVKGKLPDAADFKNVETVTKGALPEQATHVLYNETGVTPDKVLVDSQRDPSIARDVAAGKVPEAYEHLIEPKPVLPPQEAVKLGVQYDEATRSYKVVDAEGDHVQGGFDSAQEAHEYVEDEKFKAEERAAIEAEKASPNSPTYERPAHLEESSKAEQAVIPGAEQKAVAKPSDAAIAQKGTDAPLRGGNEPLEIGMFDRQKDIFDQPAKAKPQGVIPPGESGRPTSLKQFLKNNGAKFDENNNLISMKGENGSKAPESDLGKDRATQLAHEYGYTPERLSIPDLENLIKDTPEHTRAQDADRVAKMEEVADAKKWKDPAFVEDQAHKAGIDTAPVKDETAAQRTKRLIKELNKFFADQGGNAPVGLVREVIGSVINTAEKYAGKLAGDFFQKFADGYIKTFQPELMGDKARRLDAFLAKYKAAGQEAEHAYYRQFKDMIRAWDKKPANDRLQWIYDHETGRWNEETDPDHAQFQALLDATFKAEKEAIGADAEKGYKDNYLPLQFEDSAGVKKFFSSDTMVKKYGADWFTKARSFDLIQDAVRAGFKLRTDNPARMLVSRLLAGDNMMRTMDLLKDMHDNGIAVKASMLTIDKRIAKAKNAIAEIQDKYKNELADIEKQAALKDENGNSIGEPASKKISAVKSRIDNLNERLEGLLKDKAENKITPEQMKVLKDGVRIVGPDSKAYMIHPQTAPLWHNAMEMKGLWERDGITGDAYRSYMQGKAIWTQLKLGLSLFHPVHVAMIDLASDIAAGAEHLIQGGKLSDLMNKETLPNFGLSKETAKLQDHPAVQAWNTPEESRTPEQHQIVQRMIEGGFNPIMSARDTVHFRENFDKAINGIGTNNLRLLGTAASLPGVAMKPFFEHWIPGMKSEIYLRRCDDAIKRDPSLANDAGRRGEAFRQIAKDTDRTYGEMNNNVQFWNKSVRDAFNGAFISGGWKLAQIYNAKGLMQPAKIAYKFAKTGEFSKADITYNMLHAYTYTALTLALGGAINAMLGNPIGTAKDTVWDMVKNLVAPQTGEKNADGTPIRLNQPAFAKEGYNLAHEINTKGLMGGTGEFLYHQTLLPGIVDTLSNRDFIGHQLISDPTDLHQWMNAGWDTIMPISYQQYEKAGDKQSHVGKVAGVLGFPMAGAYLNQTPFEQKVISRYDELHPPTVDAYTAKLKYDLKSAISNNDAKSIDAIKARMKDEGMSADQIKKAEEPHTGKFVDVAWKSLPVQDQKRLIESASDEERGKFTLKR